MNWKNLFIFMLVAIPTMIVLTRLLAWYFGRFRTPKKESLPETGEKEAKPFLTYQEYKKELTGEGSLEGFLERCRAGKVPERPPKTNPAEVARQKLANIIRRMEEQDPVEAARQKLVDIHRRIQGNQPSSFALPQ